MYYSLPQTKIQMFVQFKVILENKCYCSFNSMRDDVQVRRAGIMHYTQIIKRQIQFMLNKEQTVVCAD